MMLECTFHSIGTMFEINISSLTGVTHVSVNVRILTLA